MKKVVCAVMTVVILLAGMCAYASSFSQDPDRIEQAAKSVLMLEIYDRQGRLIATGSGFVAFDSGTLVTNYHVIEDAYRILAISDDDQSFSITKVFCADEETDIAILGFENNTTLEPLTLWADENLKRGAAVVAIGSPKGRKNTVSKGDIGAISTDMGVLMIQFTAPISQGSSGGALFNDEGKVIGITSMILKEESQNINFAVSSAVVKAMYQAWDGSVYTVTNHKNTARFNYAGVYDEAAQATAAGTADSDAFAEVWSCPDCGNKNNSQFCLECGREKPSWKCRCGLVNHGKFCGSCGSSLQKLLDEMNEALSSIDEGNYDRAIEALNALGVFDCQSMESNAGKNCAAETQMQRAYYLRAEQGLAGNQFKQAYEDFGSAGAYADAVSRQYEVFYKQGLHQKEQGRYSDAIESFEAAAEHYAVVGEIQQCHYQLAKQYAADGKFDDAIKEYELCEGYLDAQECILRTYYAKGDVLFAEGSYSEAISAFEKAGDALDAQARILSVYYAQAENALLLEQYDEAIAFFTKIGDGLDAKERILAVYYAQAENALSLEQYDEAIAFFTKAGDYSDAASRADETKEQMLAHWYAEAEEKFNKEEYAEAAETFQLVKDYRDAKERVKQCNYCLGERAEKSGKYEEASKHFKNAGDYLDAATRQYEVLCDYAEKLRATNPSKARDLLKKLDYDRAKQLYREITYMRAEERYEKGEWSAALLLYAECEEYLDSLEKMKMTNRALILECLEKGDLTTARKQVDKTKNQPWAAGDVVVAEPGSEGKSFAELLYVAKAMGFQGWYPDGEQTYKDKYKDAILKMEKHFELEADGVIRCSEYLQLMELMIPGTESDEVRELLEYISDLGYFDALGALPEKHNTYESRYQYSIKRLETDLQLKADGFLTPTEVAVIKKQKVSAPAQISKLTLTQSKGTVSLSWTASKGAKWYEIYRDNEKIATVKGTYYADKEAVQGAYNQYTVRACKYTINTRVKNRVYVDPSYISTTCAAVAKDYSKYKNKYVQLSKAKIVSKKLVGSDYHIKVMEKVGGKNYYVVLVLSDYTGWNKALKAVSDMKTAGGKGKVYKVSLGIPYIDMEQISWTY